MEKLFLSRKKMFFLNLKMLNRIFLICFCFWTIVFRTVGSEDENDIYASQPKIITEDGHMIFMTADNHNITFRSQGSGAIRINDDDLSAVVISAKQSVSELQRIKNDEIITLRQSVLQIQSELNRFNQLTDRVSAIEASLQRINQMVSSSGTNRTQQNLATNQRRITRELRQAKTRLDNIEQALEQNECNSNPCRNGGTCVDGYKGFSCRCSTSWEGPTCEANVNECAVFAGTGLGCQNGATCVDNFGGYSCQCAAEWYGIHCTERHDDCSSASSEALCGHGTCVNQARTQAGQPRFTCICAEGWKTDGRNPACNIDVDECQEGKNPCSKMPVVLCINVDGSVRCGSCPSGYTGDGYSCTDINECFTNNGGCSVSPFVSCENTLGSRQCGPCPAGYQGNGEVCNYVGLCNINNGGCHRLATCIENPTISSTYRECRCPQGYVGPGYGPGGCIYQSSSSPQNTTFPVATGHPCDPNPCTRGTCVAVDAYSFRCNCPLGYSGLRCELDNDECASQPCQNGGTCADQINGYTCTCTSHYTGSNCEQEQDVCGGYVNQPNGTFRYPSNPSVQYRHDRNCAWAITTTHGKVLNITFPEFHLESSSNLCEYDFLQFNDGNSAAAHVIGRYCGNQPPNGGNIKTTHNSVYIWFRSDSTVASDGFQIKWNTIDPVCGGEITSPDYGSITSPGYPGMYPMSRDCVWIVRVPPGKRIQFLFPTFQLEHHDNCNFDFLKIYDGASETDHILATYCSTQTLIPSLLTSGSSARLYFHSDASLNDAGFHVTFVSMPGISGCGGLLSNARETFSSPQFPNTYDHGLECDWVIRAPPNEKLRLTFTSMDLETGHTQCEFDYVAIHDGRDDDALILGRYCGRNLPPTFVSSGNTLFVKFKTDHSIALGGFQANYQIVCGGIFNTLQGILHSPNYPSPYFQLLECTYVIQLPPGNAVRLWFEAFDIELESIGCGFDYLEIRDGSSSSAPLLGKFCGIQIPDPIISTYNFLWLRFATDASVHNRGFLANYTSIDVACGGIFHNETTGIITSPNHPEEYLINTTCRWIIQPPSGFAVRLTFSAFSLESHWNCAFDYVAIYDNNTVEDNNRRMGRYCGQRLPPVLTSSDNLMYIVFHSDRSVARDGFAAHFITFDARHLCGGDFYSNMGTIQSPNYPNRYPYLRECVWTIHVPTGQQIRLNVTDFRLDSSPECRSDYLEIRNGGHMASPLIGKFCGTTIPRSIPSHSNQLWLKFVSDAIGRSASGFRLNWDGTATGCGGEMFSGQGSIASPGYPITCSTQVDCIWQITVNRGNRIKLVFTDLDIASWNNCFNGVQISDRNNDRISVLGQYCGNHIPDPILSSSNEVLIKFRCTFMSASQRGFQISYSTECNTTLSGRRGVIESPNFPNPYPHHRNCTWNINAPMGNKINMSFAVLRLESGSSCQYDFIEIKERGNHNTTSIGRFCGIQDVPPPLYSQTDAVQVQFQSDYSLAFEGFSLEWVASGCGNEFTKSSGNFSTPNYPDPYPLNTICDWEITVGLGQRIELTIQEYDIESSSNCVYDSLKVYGGADTNAPLLTSLCHMQTSPSVVTSSGNRMYLRFKSDVSQVGRGFLASYVAKPGGCGGRFKVPSGVIHSQNFPNFYVARDDCTWLITVNEGHTITLQFTDFDIKPQWNCSAVYVAVYDGPNENNTQLMQHCGSQLPSPPNISSTTNQVLIRMRAHDSITARGFQLKYFTDCGATIYADEPGEISLGLEGSDRSARTSHNCTWIIRARNLQDRVSLTVTYLDKMVISFNQTSCRDDFVEVYDGEANDSQTLQHLCANSLPPSITSRGPALRVVAVSRLRRLHFRAVYREALTACGGDLQALQGTFTSPEYPNSYPADIECVWTIKSSPGNRVMIAFSFLNIQDSDYCNQDYIEIRETDFAGHLLGRYCGSEIPAFNFTSANQLMVKFSSDSEEVGRGFVASYSLLHGSDLTGTSGQIASPLYPQRFRHSGQFAWTVTVPSNMYVTITFVKMFFNMRPLQRCRVGLKVYDGADKTAAILGEYCSSGKPNPIISTTNQLHITFSNWQNSIGVTFLLNWNATMSRRRPDQYLPTPPPQTTTTNITGCSGYIYLNKTNMYSESYYQLTSPGYPNRLSRLRLQCEWMFSSPVGTSVVITFNQLDFGSESHYGCYNNFVKILGASRIPGEWKNLGQYCRRSQLSTEIKSGGNAMKVQLKTSPYLLNGTGFSAYVYPVCGGNISTPSGVIESPLYPQNYPESKQCEWLVSVRPGRTIQVEFIDLQLEGDVPICQNDYVIVRNGQTNVSPWLGAGKYCGSSLPNPRTLPKTTSNHLYVQFISNSAISNKGFKLAFSEISVECDRVIILNEDNPSNTIHTPNFPSPYPSQTECRWRVVAPIRTRIQMHFEDHFDIPSQQRCQNNYLAVYDGGTANSRRVGMFCGSDMPGTIQSTSNILFIQFSSNDIHPSIGFKATIKIGDCGGTVIANEGSITSPNYPTGYAADLDCEWIIRGQLGHFISINIANLHMVTRSVNCSISDSLQIRDYNSTGTLLGEYCGQLTNEVVQTADNVAYVRFKTQSQSLFAGFRLTFNISAEECGGELTTPTGVITSPNFPRAYPSHRVCHWTILAMRGRKIRLSFTHLDVGRSPLCTSFVVVLNGLSGMYVLPPYHICGTTLPPAIESTSNTMAVQFLSADTVSGTGFRAVYDTDLEWDCGGDLPVPSGNLTSPGYENGNYSHNLNCFWNLNSPRANASYVFRFHELSLEGAINSNQCIFDKFEIRGGLDESGILFASLCGNISTPHVIAIPYPQVYLNLRTDTSIAHVGFFMTYTTTVSCGNQLPEVGGILRSPGYPSAYFNDAHCAWLINLQEGQQAQITFDDFQLQNSENCSSDFVLIRNGLSLGSPVIGRYCGDIQSQEIRTQRHEAMVEFHTNTDTTTGRGFSLSVTPVRAGCGGIFHGENGQLSSVNYPNNYPANTECEWILEGEEGYFFNITFIERFDLEMHSRCQLDFIEGFDFLEGEWVSTGRKCGRNIPAPLVSKTNKFRLIFRSNEVVDGDGFKANWTKYCGGTFNDLEGSFQSPGYPANYLNGLECNYLINLKEREANHYTVITFEDYFSIEQSDDCGYDAVQIFSIKNGTKVRLRKVCGTTSPGLLSFLGSMLVRFTTDSSVTAAGFRVNYRSSECGGILRASNGLITSPTHPDKYHANMRCIWNVIGDANRVIAFKFLSINLEGGFSCGFDYVAIYDGNSINDTLIGRFCASTLPSVLKTTGSNATVMFVTDNSVQLSGFRLVYQKTFGENVGCGGMLNASSGSIQSLDYDGDRQYESELDCAWTIIGEEFKIITLTFQRFDVERTYNSSYCSWDYLEIRDGISNLSPLIARLCGTVLPLPITSSSNKLWLKFVTDDTVNRAGFSATYQVVNPICGGVLNFSDDDWTIQSPNYPQDYPINLRCRWVIPNPRRILIQIHFEEFKLENSSMCQKDYLYIQDSFDISRGMQSRDVKLCGSVRPNDHTVLRNVIHIDFISDSSTTNKGFKLMLFTRTCNRSFTTPYGTVNFVSNYPRPITGDEVNRTCIHNIQVAVGRTISLIFSSLGMAGSNCAVAYLEVRDGSSETAPLLAKICGGPTNPIFSTQNSLYLKLYHRQRRSSSAVVFYKANYYSTDKGPGCGGQVATANMGYANPVSITSPNYPGNYSRDSVCQWEITAPPTQYITASFQSFDIQPVGNCTSNYVELFDGTVAVDSHKLVTLCPGDRPSNAGIRTTTNSLLVKYFTDTFNSGTGFKLRFFSLKIAGGGEPQIEVVQKPSASSG